jgi:demethylmenaquinone methyltransferase/2-methoxy-6-polyprenyl-1,4-benzoquinol methylase
LTRNGIERKYNRHAFLYDLDDAVFFGTKGKLRKRALGLADVGKGMRVLDVMAGTGKTTLLAAKNGANVVGVDYSKSMLRIARRRLRKHGHADVKLRLARAEKLPFKDNSFDAVVCTYGLDTVYNPVPVMKEMTRVVKSGGSIAAAYKSNPSGLVGGFVDCIASAYLRWCWKCRNVELEELFEGAGLVEVEVESYYMGIGKVIGGQKP